MATYLLTWNPDAAFRWDNLEKDVAAFQAGELPSDRWSTGNTKKIVEGDRLFLIKLGSEPRGIMAAGWAVSKWYEADHWDGSDRSANFVRINFDALLDPWVRILEYATLQEFVSDEYNWSPQAGGQTIPDDVAERLETEWARRLASGPNPFPPLEPSEVVTNDRIREVFQCSGQGGMRRALATNSLVLVTSLDGGDYHDRWVEDTLHYTGMGLTGDQSLDFGQNRTLAGSASDTIRIYLFEKLDPNAYTYVGRVRLTGDPYTDTQHDRNGHPRQVWMFPIGLHGGGPPPPLGGAAAERIIERREQAARRLSDQELARRAAEGDSEPGRRQVQTTTYDRNPHVAEFARRAAQGMCQLCDEDAPFHDRHGRPHLETHHIVWLSREGPDTVENCVALCPNCHRKMHVLDEPADRRTLAARAGQTSLQ